MDRGTKTYSNSKDPSATEKYLDQEQPMHAAYLRGFRVEKCEDSCTSDDCIKCHATQKPRRRPLLSQDGKWSYVAIMCKNPQPCKIGDRCRFCHTSDEYNYHPLLYKITNCKFPSTGKGKCSKLGFHCSFAHSESDLRARASQAKSKNSPLGFIIETFKTEKCENSYCTQEDCIRYHSALEKRRSPCWYTYSTIPCSYVYKNYSFTDLRACPYKDACRSAHSKNEIYYHPNMYKTKACNVEPCYKKYCAFWHREDDIQSFFERIKGEMSEESIPISSESREKLEIEGDKKDEVFGNDTVESKNSTEDTFVQEHSAREEEVKEGVDEKEGAAVSKLTCKQCMEMEIKWVMECGAVLCGGCIGKVCLLCNRKHLTRIYF